MNYNLSKIQIQLILIHNGREGYQEQVSYLLDTVCPSCNYFHRMNIPDYETPTKS